MRAPERVTTPASLEAYITGLDAALAALPADERREIILETRSHVTDRMQRDPSVKIDDVLAELGNPGSYALGFLAKSESNVEDTTLTRVAALANGGWKQLPILFLVATGYGIAVFFVFIAISKLLEPDATGLYVSTGKHWFAGLVLSDPNHSGRDILGYWLVPIAISLAGIIHWVLSRLLRRVTRKHSSI